MYAITWHLTNADGFGEYGTFAGYKEDSGITPVYQSFKDDGKIKAEGQYNKTATEMDDTVVFDSQADWNAYKAELDKLNWTNCTIEITDEREVGSVDDHPSAAHLTKY
jgi:hypothetical protein|tara:strand:- start:2017 stop:2340 length:324 start_codon:yes stop_codon:yes gene_type:complete